MIARRPSYSRTRKVRFDAPPVPPPPAPPIPPGPTIASGSTKIPSYPLIVVGVMLLAAVALGVSQFVTRGKHPQSATASVLTDAQLKTEDDVASIVARVSKRISVNANETPTVASVEDPDVLKAQNAVFYKEAEVGDRLLLWSDKAVLYSMKRDIILNAIAIPATLDVQKVSAPSVPIDASSEKAVIEVRNGSGVVGLGKTVAAQLAESGFSVLPATNATIKGNQQTTIYVPANRLFPATVQKLQSIFGESSALVTSTIETGIKGDVLVVVGFGLKH